MATKLQIYLKCKENMESQTNGGTLPLDQILVYQEVCYRISVLQSCQAYNQTAPVTTNIRAIMFHFQMLDAYLCALQEEHKVGVPADEKRKEQRRTAAQSFGIIVQNCRKPFLSFRASTPELYKSKVGILFSSILPAWIQYRDSYIPFDTKNNSKENQK